MLLGFTAAVLAHSVLALRELRVEQAHQDQEPPPEVSTYHLALHIRSGYEGMLTALPPEQWPSYDGDPMALIDRLLQLARNIDPRLIATSKHGPKVSKPKGYVDGEVKRTYDSTAGVLAQARTYSWIKSVACTSLSSAPTSNLPTKIRISCREISCCSDNLFSGSR